MFPGLRVNETSDFSGHQGSDIPARPAQLLGHNSIDYPKIRTVLLYEGDAMSTRWIVTFSAIDPKNPAETWNVGLPEWRWRVLTQKRHESKIAQLRLVEEILKTGGTERLYEGWSRSDTDDCAVYVGCPTRNWTSPSIETPPPKNCLFLVFVLPDGTIDDWTWRPCSEDDPMSPSGVKGKLIWPKNQI